MITAFEALKASEQHTEVAKQLKLIEKEIIQAASEGKFSVWWHVDRMIVFNLETLIEKLEEIGYKVRITGVDQYTQLYIDWRDAK